MITYITGLDTYLVLVLGTAATFIVCVNGAIPRTLPYLASKFFLLYVLWIILAVPTSHWMGGSVQEGFSYVRTCLPVLFIVGGAVVTARDYFRMMHVIAFASALNVFSMLAFATDQERLSIAFGTMGNANDFAAHLLFVLPCAMWVALTAKSKVARIFYIGVVLTGLLVGARTGSRGGMLASAAVLLLLFIRANNTVRLTTLVLMPILGFALFSVLPSDVRDRYATIFEGTGTVEEARTQEAIASSATRAYLMKEGIDLAVTHPLFGVGLGQFTDVSSEQEKAAGRRGLWLGAHNSYLQVAAEDGIPAFIFYSGTIVAAYFACKRCYSRCAGRPDLRKLQLAGLCMMMSIVGFGVASFFTNLPYFYYVPMMAGLAVSLDRVADQEIKFAQRNT